MNKSSQEKYEEFLLVDHKAISDAHFNTTVSISSFFRYYILIVSLPMTVFLAVIKFDQNISFQEICDKCGYAIPCVAFGIAFLGIFVMAYILNLRFDALLYARHVNGIRRYFTNLSDAPYEEEARFRSLPINTSYPNYFEKYYFIWVIRAFALLNSFYFIVGIKSLGFITKNLFHYLNSPFIYISGGLLFFLCHIFLYYKMAKWRETGYDMNRHIIGIDIDGVLNTHREHFCNILKERCNKDISPESITEIPVHNCSNLDITEQEEHDVFNDVKYWKEMPPVDSAPLIIKKLKNIFHFKIYIFTYRPWPDKTIFPKDKKQEYDKCWFGNSIERITETWLKRYNFLYDKLIIEKGNTNTTCSNILTKNRFIWSSKKRIKYFIEDDLIKAQKLANICDVVFLFDQPYNNSRKLPHNVIRVNSWNQLYNLIRRFS